MTTTVTFVAAKSRFQLANDENIKLFDAKTLKRHSTHTTKNLSKNSYFILCRS